MARHDCHLHTEGVLYHNYYRRKKYSYMGGISFVCGDFNINLLEINSNPHYNDYFESIYSKGFFPRITLPTRIQPPSFSLIDNILCNSLDDAAKSVSGVLITDISDHKMIFTFTQTIQLSRK